MTALICTVALTMICVFAHYEGLRLLSALSNPEGRKHRPRSIMLVIVFGVISIHLTEIMLFAVGYWLGEAVLNIGTFTILRDRQVLHLLDYFYFSAETYTTLGIGDAYPVGELRLIASIEALVGLLLIGWSTSFTYISMSKYWDGHQR